ncbi:replication-associated recombination protein A [Sporosalibacterium faouarense]|uniref:replication-associated recombination protein A n=1 Tax=Sporosalibacterium faouarense TaxID=516123 RepID=UPI00141D71BE|nr:replication-associated recombination protein A [Sporosalibacterium faouarense]MTI49010.1 replication-associated recombination protein A [Bacillota bacterium]
MKPLADLVRPQSLKDVVGQEHILGENKLLKKVIDSKHIPNMIFYGPPGTGKTTVANIIANATNKKIYKLNATDASLKDIKGIVNNLDTLFTQNGVLLYLDEIQNFNKKQQQSLLKFIENGQITLISSTTENPYFTIFQAIISRSTVFEFKKLDEEDILKGLKRTLFIAEEEIFKREIKYNEDALIYIAQIAGGDLRRAITNLELALLSNKEKINDGDFIINIEIAKECTLTTGFAYDKFGDNHYDILSAFQKSIRGSDPDAAVHYLARLVKAGDLQSICRRLLVIASEDIGLAYPTAINIVNNCVDAAMKLGFPEARIPLAQAVILLASSPKSNSAISAIDKALKDLDTKNIGDIPYYLKDAHYKNAKSLGRGIGYQYPHDFPNHYVKQDYLPKELSDAKYYEPCNNKIENRFMDFLNGIKK